ncbi:Uncharacterised protein [Escherichia coli]|nr:Uncharacterised protein [Escherichia coli]
MHLRCLFNTLSRHGYNVAQDLNQLASLLRSEPPRVSWRVFYL